MEKRDIAIIAVIAVVAVISIAAVIVFSDSKSDDDEGTSQSYNLGSEHFVRDRIVCDQTSLGIGDAGSMTYKVYSQDSGWSYNGVTMYDVTIEVEVATQCETRDFSIRGAFSGDATLIEKPTTNYDDLVYSYTGGYGFGEQWFHYSFRVDSVYTYVFKIESHVLLDDGDAGLDLQFSVSFVDSHDSYAGYAGAEIDIRQSASS